MKHRSNGLALACIFATVLRSADASSVDLRIAGSIEPGGACDMTMDNGALEYGRVKLDPDPSRETPLGERKVRVAIECDSPTRYALVANGIPSHAGEDDTDFGLFSASDLSVAGKLHIRFDGASAYTESRRLYYTMTADTADLENAPWGPSSFSTRVIPRGHAMGFVLEDGSYEPPAYVQHVKVDLLVSPAIRPAKELDLNDDIAFSGQVGFEIRYF